MSTPVLLQQQPAECEAEDNNKMYALGAAGLFGASAVAYWAMSAESALLKKVPLTDEQRSKYLGLLKRTGSPNAAKELDGIRAQFAAALSEGSKDPVVKLTSKPLVLTTDEGVELSFPGVFFDRNGDGLLDFGEFLVAFVLISEFFRTELRSRKDVQAVVFNSMDENGNGLIDKEELSCFMHVAICLGLVSNFQSANQAATYWLSQFDVNGDGQIDFREFCTLEQKAVNYTKLMANRREMLSLKQDEMLNRLNSRLGRQHGTGGLR